MRSFHVLFIDDEEAQVRPVKELEQDIEGLRVDFAPDQPTALDLIARSFYHLAIVDVSLQGGAREDTDGLFIMERLREARPYCERLLHTTVASEDRREVLKALAPALGQNERLAHGYVDKVDPGLRAPEVVRDRAERWLARPVSIIGAEDLLDHLLSREIEGLGLSNRHGKIKPTEVEIETVLSELFGQGQMPSDFGADTISVDLHLISVGWSKSVVLWCDPSSKDRIGPRCLVKIGPRLDSVQEVDRYRSFVRYGLGLNYRVELLASVVGDTIGAACYTHFEARGDSQNDLQHLFNDENRMANVAIEQLFDPGSPFWTADPSTGSDLALFFQDEYSQSIRDLVRSFEAFVDRRPELSLAGNRRAVDWGNLTAPVPCHEDLAMPAFSGRYGACLVHGDLHGGNVLVTSSGQPVLIDYRNMGRGPRLLDFVSLEVSLRMSTSAVSRIEVLGPELFGLERQVWDASWSDRPPDAGPRPYWEQTSLLIRDLAIKNNPEATPIEYAATALLRTMRVLSAFAPEDDHRLRLLPFLSVLTDVLRQSEAG